MGGGGLKEAKTSNFTHQKVNKLNFGDFPLHCIPTCPLGRGGGGWRGVAIKVQEKEEDVEKRRWRKRGERWREENEGRKEHLI